MKRIILYFIGLKMLEFMGVIFVLGVLFFPYYGLCLVYNTWIEPTCPFWFGGFGLIALFAIIFFIVAVGGYGLVRLLRANWQWAKKLAEKHEQK